MTTTQHQRAATRARLVKNLRNAAQALAALQARQRQQSASQQAGGAMGAVGSGGAPPLIGGDTPEAVAVCAALEQCLFHRIRVKEFGEGVRPRNNNFSWRRACCACGLPYHTLPTICT